MARDLSITLARLVDGECRIVRLRCGMTNEGHPRDTVRGLSGSDKPRTVWRGGCVGIAYAAIRRSVVELFRIDR